MAGAALSAGASAGGVVGAGVASGVVIGVVSVLGAGVVVSVLGAGAVTAGELPVSTEPDGAEPEFAEKTR